MRIGNRNGFKCRTCRTFHPFGAYAVAQMAMGHTLTHRCQCGAEHMVYGEGATKQTVKGQKSASRSATRRPDSRVTV